MSSFDHLFRVYEPHECGEDGYPFAWHKGSLDTNPDGSIGQPPVKDFVREQAGYRCVRCGHPYAKGDGEWSDCDENCAHAGPVRFVDNEAEFDATGVPIRQFLVSGRRLQARWRILTVHHLNGDKRDCRWWNLAALDQRCHLVIQGKVKMDRPYDKQHSGWFVPYVAGFYAAKYLGEELTRDEALARADELLALELRQFSLPGITA